MSDVPSAVYSCPFCNATVEIAGDDSAHPINCPHCGEAFVLPQRAAAGNAEAELDGQRIRKFAAVRRAAYRSRSYCVIAVGACAVGAIELLYHVVAGHSGLGNVRAAAYVIVAIGLLWGAQHFSGLARHYHREAKRSALPPPIAPPDFSPLSDGSQIVRDLERM
jgi:DNA-directed RNA polymerase subunit RPC12/RpoP